MLQLENESPFEAMPLLAPDPDGVQTLYTVIKGTFVLSPSPTIAEEQLPVALEDEYYGDPGTSSLKTASEMTLMKPGTDVMLVGTAYAPNAKPTRQMDVSLSVGSLKKTVRVFGDRIWTKGVIGAQITDPEPFETMSLIWERCFGGTDQTDTDPPQLHAEKRNPVGVGYREQQGTKDLDGLKLPNIENPDELIQSWKDRPTPVGFAPICGHWEPRRSYAGTYDEQWQKHRAPYLPTDFDPRFFQQAPPDLVLEGFLKGNEEFEVVGADPTGELRFTLPHQSVRVRYRFETEVETPHVNLDTVVIEPDEGRLVVVWRTQLKCDKKELQIREIEVCLENRG